ncbi:MAG: GCN5-related N-acetyltransferase [Parcubacteria group bacterium GW2011_GWA2_44_12]|nr:MAG: GCN5-related N-acetyltransferase [Parcubacteria group bacterium GW2011_GWA2_44_12]
MIEQIVRKVTASHKNQMTKTVSLRQYEASDKEAVWQLHVNGLNQTGSFIFDPALDADFENIKENYLCNGGEFFVVSLNDEVIAMGALRKVDEKTAEVKRMRVKNQYQRQGIGSMMLESLIQRAKELGYKKLILDTSERQSGAKRLYEKYGFSEYKRARLNDHTIIYYELTLDIILK